MKEKLPYAVFGFGENILHFYKIEGGQIKLNVCDWLRKVRGSYFFRTEKELKQLAFDEDCALRFALFSRGEADDMLWEKYFVPCLKKNEVFETKKI